jgi:hypothetical protein
MINKDIVIGNKIICIDNNSEESLLASSTLLTIGKEYVIEGVTYKGVYIKNDDGFLQHYYFYRFMLLEDMKNIVEKLKKE